MSMQRVKSVCPYCGVGCGIIMDVSNGRVSKLSGDKSHPTNFGRLCTKGSTCAEAITAGGRLDRAYIRRRDGGDGDSRDQIPVDIDTAISEAARRLRAFHLRRGLGPSNQLPVTWSYRPTTTATGCIPANQR